MNPMGFFVVRLSTSVVSGGLEKARLGRNFVTIWSQDFRSLGDSFSGLDSGLEYRSPHPAKMRSPATSANVPGGVQMG